MLPQHNLYPCTGCNACQEDRREPCMWDDDMQMVYDKMPGASAVLCVSPVYSWALTLQVKIVLDRKHTWGDYQSIRHAAALAGRPMGLAICCADADPATNGCIHVYNLLEAVAEASGGTFAGCVHTAASARGDVLQHPGAIQQARELGMKLFHMSKRADG